MDSLISSTSTCIFHYMLLELFFTSTLIHLRRCFSSSLSIQTPSLLTSLTSSTTTHHRHFNHHPSSSLQLSSIITLQHRPRPKHQFLSTFKLQTFISLQFFRLSNFKLSLTQYLTFNNSCNL